jgi:hypothetical protein
VVLVAGVTVIAGAPAGTAAGSRARDARGSAQAVAGIAKPALGDWEGSGPHGLQLSFEFVRQRSSARLRYLALSQPSGCRIGDSPGFSTTYFADSYYYAATRYPQPIPRAGFVIKPAGDFAIVAVDTRHPLIPFAVAVGRFTGSRAGSVAVPAYPFRCATGGWPKTVHFRLVAGRRAPVGDGTYMGAVVGPPAGITGTIRATMVGGGRVLTDFAVAWTCPEGGGASFELGPSAATGEFVGADGSVDAHFTLLGTWSGRFNSGGSFAGTFSNARINDCTQGQSTAFTATRT